MTCNIVLVVFGIAIGISRGEKGGGGGGIDGTRNNGSFTYRKKCKDIDLNILEI